MAARRRYKILLREQTRLKDRGTRDAETDEELLRLRTEYPELNEVQPTLSAGTAAMLTFAESMSPTSSVGEAAIPPGREGEDVDATKEKATAAASHSEDSKTLADDAPAGVPWFVSWALPMISYFVALVGSFIQPPRTARWLCLLVILWSAVVPLMHRIAPAMAPCVHGSVARDILVDPLSLTGLMHATFFMVRCRGTHPAAYIVRDLVPALLTSFVVYSCATMILNLFTHLRPVRTFC